MNIVDDLDQRLIAALRHDARSAISDLAATLGITRATVRARMARLQERGDIVGFSVVTRADVAPDPVRGLMMVGIEGRGTDRILRQLNGLSAVRTSHTTNGRWDIIVEIGAETLEEFDRVLSQIRRMDGIVSSETSLLLSTRKASA